MGRTIEFRWEDGDYVKQWPNWTGEVPQLGDTVLLHFGDNNEEELEYEVVGRTIDGTKPELITVYLMDLILNSKN